jgi:hypothetical protein
VWKIAWEEELQSMEEQFLDRVPHRPARGRKAVTGTEIYGHIEKVTSTRGASGGRGFKDHGGLSTVMLEIRGASVDPERRLKAIEASQKNRERELAGRADEFEAGLKVGGELKMTGGAQRGRRSVFASTRTICRSGRCLVVKIPILYQY